MTKRTTKIQINFNERESESIEFLVKQFSLSSTQELLRFLIARAHKVEKDNLLKYGKSSTAERKMMRQDELKNIQARFAKMNDDEFNDFLHECQYFQPDEVMADNENLILKERFEGGFSWIIYQEVKTGNDTSRVQKYSKDEIIKQLIKEQKIWLKLAQI